ncbi:glycosyltransferase, partial [Proteus terrae]
AIGLLGVWNLAYKLTQNTNLAWFAMLALNLSGVINFDIIPYNDNQKYWIGFAITMGIATMGKYSSLAFIGSVFLSSLFVPKVR